MIASVEIPAALYAAYLAMLEPAFLRNEQYGPGAGAPTRYLDRALTAKERAKLSYARVKAAKADPKSNPVQYDRFVYGKIRRATQIDEATLRRKLNCQPGMLKGSLKRLKDANWIVYLPGTNVYMTVTNYKQRLTDGVTDDDLG